MKKEQFNIMIKSSTRERLEKFVSNNGKLFEKRRGVKSVAAELLLEIGLDVAEKEVPKDK